MVYDFIKSKFYTLILVSNNAQITIQILLKKIVLKMYYHLVITRDII
jgi:hypothetical protein